MQRPPSTTGPSKLPSNSFCGNSSAQPFDLRKSFADFENAHPHYRDLCTRSWCDTQNMVRLDGQAFLQTKGSKFGICHNHSKKRGYSIFWPSDQAEQVQESHSTVLSQVKEILDADKVSEDAQLKKRYFAMALGGYANVLTEEASNGTSARFYTMGYLDAHKLAAQGLVTWYPGSADADGPLEYRMDPCGGELVRTIV